MRYEIDGDINFQLDQLLNQGLEFNDNLRGALLETDLVLGINTIQHGLGFIPIGFIVIFAGTITSVEGVPVDALKVVKRVSDDFLLFIPGVSTSVESFTGTRINEWTTEELFLNASVVSQGVRLFVL